MQFMFVELEPGPLDTSVLYLQDSHRSSNEALMNDTKLVVPTDRSSKLKLIDIKDPRFEPHLKVAGFWKVMQIEYIRLDHHLITALCDRWRPETNTFHFRVGEMTITLADVHHMLGIETNGRPIYVENHDIDYMELFSELLGVEVPEEERKWTYDVSMSWFRNVFKQPLSQDATDIEIVQRTRAVILYFINSTLFTDHSKGRCSLRFLPFLRDLMDCAQYSWGGALLAYLYNELTQVAIQKSNTLCGCMVLLQLWSWTHIAIGRPDVTLPTHLDPNLPLGCKWNVTRHWKETPKNINFYRNELDILPDELVTWDPYPIGTFWSFYHQHLGSKCRLIVFYEFQNYNPDRVMRQFGFSQHIPDPVIPIDSNPDHWTNVVIETMDIWRRRIDFVIHERTPPTSMSEYEWWYWQITRRYILKESSRRLVAYIPRAPLERNVVSIILFCIVYITCL